MSHAISMSDVVFEADETDALLRPAKNETAENMLGRKGVFFLKDVVKVLPLQARAAKKQAKQLKTQGLNPWVTMGLRKIWNHWLVRMSVFAPYCQEHLAMKWRAILEEWDANRLLRAKGVFKMAEVATACQ